MALTETQKYLLGRLPKVYDIKPRVKDPEPATVRQARKVIEAYEGIEKEKRESHQRKMKKKLEIAREAIYFKTEKALELIKALELEMEN